MRALVIERPGHAAVNEVPDPEPGVDDVLVRSRLVGICRTDLEILDGVLPAHRVSYPCVPGHEWTGEVVAVGSAVADLEPGERVVCEGNIFCGRCASCRRGRTNLCVHYDQLGFTRPGGGAELVVVPRRVVHSLGDVTPETGVLIEPASCVLRAFERVAPQQREVIAVVGIGTLGAIALRLAGAYSPTELYAVGIRDHELRLARELGATETIDLNDSDSCPSEVADVVIEAAGAPQAVENAVRLAKRGGRVALLGLAGKDAHFSLTQDEFVRKDLSMLGCVSYASSDWRKMVDLVAGRPALLDDLISHRFPLSDFEQAFERLRDPHTATTKVLLQHGA